MPAAASRCGNLGAVAALSDLRAGARSWLARRAGLEPDVVWLLGTGRSGSTWLFSMLRRCGDVVGVNEPLVGAHLGALSSDISSDESNLSTVYESSRGRPQYVFSDAHRPVWEPLLRDLVLRRLQADVEAARAARPADHSRRPLVVVKEPNGSLAAPLLASLFPASRLLLLVRDGRDVIDSSLDAVTASWGGRDARSPLAGTERRTYVERRARLWAAAMAATGAAFDAHDPSRRLRVHYEDLRVDTRAELGRIVGWLGRAVDDAQIDAIATNLAFEAIPEERRGAGRFTRAATPGLWRDNLTAEEQRLVADLIGPTLEELGYGPEGRLGRVGT